MPNHSMIIVWKVKTKELLKKKHLDILRFYHNAEPLRPEAMEVVLRSH